MSSDRVARTQVVNEAFAGTFSNLKEHHLKNEGLPSNTFQRFLRRWAAKAKASFLRPNNTDRRRKMSFDLEVISPVDLPSDLGAKICSELRKLDVDIEFYPGFEPASWEGGFLPVKVLTMPQAYIGCVLQSPAISGFEVSFYGRQTCFRSPACRTTTEFTLLSLCAGAIAKITGGRLEMPGADLPPSGKDPIVEGIEILEGFVEESSDEDRRQNRFERWDPE